MPSLLGLSGLAAITLLPPEAGWLLIVWPVLFAWWRRTKRKPETIDLTDPAEEEDLASFGILEIRPVTGAASPSEQEAAVDVVTDHVQNEDDADSVDIDVSLIAEVDGTISDREAAGQAIKRAAIEAEMVDGVSRPKPLGKGLPQRRVLGHHPEELPAVESIASRAIFGLRACLYALWSATGAQTICLLAQDSVAPRYRIQGVVSQNGYARTTGAFPTTAPLLNAEMMRQPIIARSVSSSDLAARDLRYYRVDIAVRDVLLLPIHVPGADATYILLADTLDVGGLDTVRQQQVLVRGAALLSTLLTPEDHLDPLPPSLKIESKDNLELQPRREIIRDEMATVRARKVPLGLALIYVNKAEEVAAEGAAPVLALEELLHDEIGTLSPGGRVERFGELMYGVFQYETAEALEKWATDIHAYFEDEAILRDGGVSIGVAMLNDRHEDSDQFRHDATMALREAFESGGGCVIVE